MKVGVEADLSLIDRMAYRGLSRVIVLVMGVAYNEVILRRACVIASYRVSLSESRLEEEKE